MELPKVTLLYMPEESKQVNLVEILFSKNTVAFIFPNFTHLIL